MGIASLIIGICSAVLAIIPLCSFLTTIPALVGLALGIVEVVMKSKQSLPKGLGIAGIIVNGLAIIFALIWGFVLVAVSVANS